FLPIDRSAAEMRLDVTPSFQKSWPITSRMEMLLSSSFAAAWTSGFQRLSAEGMISVRRPGRAVISACGSLRLLIFSLLVETEPIHKGRADLAVFRLLLEGVQRDHGRLHRELVGIRVVALAQVELRPALIAGHEPVVDHLAEEGGLGLRIHLQKGLAVKLRILPAIAGGADQLLLDPSLYPVTDRINAKRQPCDEDGLDARAPHGLALSSVADDDRRHAKPAANFLDIKAPRLEHLGVFRIERNALPLHSCFKDADTTGIVAAHQRLDQRLARLCALF